MYRQIFSAFFGSDERLILKGAAARDDNLRNNPLNMASLEQQREMVQQFNKNRNFVMDTIDEYKKELIFFLDDLMSFFLLASAFRFRKWLTT